MKTTMKITLRALPVKIQDTRTGKTTEDKIVLTKEQLHAADLVGQSSKELITRLYNREGYKVLEIGKAEKQSGELNLEAAYLMCHFMEDGGAENSSPEDCE